MSQTRPAHASALQIASPSLAFTAHKRPQAATNDLDILQGELAKFDLSLEGADIVQRSRWNNKAADGITKAPKGKLNIIHFSIPHYERTKSLNHTLFEFKQQTGGPAS
jgi:hypothetical protein